MANNSNASLPLKIGPEHEGIARTAVLDWKMKAGT